MTSALNLAWQKEQSRLRPTVLTPEAVSWLDGPNPERYWVPEDLTPLWGTSSYNQFNDRQRLSYNQFYGQQLAEEFHWIESCLICAPLKALCASNKGDTARSDVLASFLEDETNHVASFEMLVAGAAKCLGGEFNFFRPPLVVRQMGRLAAFVPTILPFWVLAVQAFETYAVSIGQRYQTDETLDPVFRDVFVRHARDEARHCQYDALLDEWLIKGRAGVLSALNTYLSGAFANRYYDSRWGLDGPIGALVKAYPELAAFKQSMIQDAMAARDERSAPAIQPH